MVDHAVPMEGSYFESSTLDELFRCELQVRYPLYTTQHASHHMEPHADEVNKADHTLGKHPREVDTYKIEKRVRHSKKIRLRNEDQERSDIEDIAAKVNGDERHMADATESEKFGLTSARPNLSNHATRVPLHDTLGQIVNFIKASATLSHRSSKLTVKEN
ncbi:hypothetical protein KEM48_014130 [Puccinia striiformis f. sp. tritici PST-130]|nr:hypothetical protein KEM48_014130 [Puccinia striiformis f. sp. tritici PST-130]